MAETMNGSWGFNLTDDAYKSPKTLIRTLVGAAGRNANFLSNTGPMPNGKLQPENVATLQEIGSWLKVNGRSVYGTRGGPVSPRPWGVTTQSRQSIFVHIFDWRESALEVPLAPRIAAAVDLATGRPVRFTQKAGIVRLDGVANPDDAADRVVELRLR